MSLWSDHFRARFRAWTLGMYESCLAILAIRFGSRVASRAPYGSTSAGSVSALVAAIISVTSHTSGAATDCILLRSPKGFVRVLLGHGTDAGLFQSG